MSLCVLILAGGLGTRLRSVVEDVPKSLAPIRNIPFLIYLLDWLDNQNVSSEVVLSVGYKAELIKQQVGDRYKKLRVHYAMENTPLGTGGAIKNSVQQFPGYNHYLLLNGDTYSAVNLNEFIAFHELNGADVSIASRSMRDFDRYGALTIDESHNVTRFNEKTFMKEGYINCGVYLLTSAFCRKFIQGFDGAKFSFEKDVLEGKKRQFSIKAFVSDFYFKDIGVPDDYFAAQHEFPSLVS